MKVTYVQDPDGFYEAIYVDGKSVIEGDCLITEDVLKALGIAFDKKYLDEDWFYKRKGKLPKDLSKVKLED